MLFEFIRKLTIPFNQIEKSVPNHGKILDVGCGHGILSRIIAQNYPQTKVLGIDPSNYKINIARLKSRNIPNLEYKCSYLKDIHGIFDCIIITDVLYLFSGEERIIILKGCYKLLKKGGLLIICEIDSKPSFMFWLSYLEEIIMVKIIKYTYSDMKKIFFLDTKSQLKNLKDVGFKVITHKNIQSILPYHRIMYISEKNYI